jgi:hypothetical protein
MTVTLSTPRAHAREVLNLWNRRALRRGPLWPGHRELVGSSLVRQYPHLFAAEVE